MEGSIKLQYVWMSFTNDNNKDIYGVTIVSKFRHGSSHFEKGKKGVTMKLDVTTKCNCNKKNKKGGGGCPTLPGSTSQSKSRLN